MGSTAVADRSLRRPHPGRLALFRAGRTNQEFAAYIGRSPKWVSTVFSGRAPAPASFRRALAEFTGEPESALFPEFEQ